MKNKKAINKPRLLLLIFIFAAVAVGALFYLNIGGVRVRLTADSEAEIPIQTTDSNILIVYFNVPIVYVGAKYVFRATRHYKKNDGTPFTSEVIGRDDCEYWDQRAKTK